MADYRILKRTPYNNERDYVEAAGNTGDTKPVGLFVNGSWCLNVDTRKVSFYSEATESWKED